MVVRDRLVSLSRIAVVLALTGCVGAGAADGDEAALIITSHCSLVGSGEVLGDTFDGDIHDAAGTAAGAWSHDGSAGLFEGTPTEIQCRINGSTIADVLGTGTLDGVPGYHFTLHAQDRGDPSHPTRLPGPTETITIEASRTYSPSRWTDGTRDFAAGALVSVPASIPVTVGNAGNQWTHLSFVDHDSGEPIRCMYRGGAAHPNPTASADIAAGLVYTWARCERYVCESDDDLDDDSDERECDECEWENDPSIVPGTSLDVDSIELHVQSGSSRYPSRSAARTTVALTLDVAPFVYRASEPDSYRLVVLDPAGAAVMIVDGDVTPGDLAIVRLP